MSRCIIALALLALLAVAGSAPSLAANEFEPVENILAAAVAAAAAGAEARVEVRIDPGLRLPRCEQPLQAHATTEGTVEVSCKSRSGWRMYAPVRTSRIAPVLILTRAVHAGQTIDEDMVALERREVGRLGDAALSDPEQAVGRLAGRALSAGTVLAASDLVSPQAVRRRDVAMLASLSGGTPGRG